MNGFSGYTLLLLWLPVMVFGSLSGDVDIVLHNYEDDCATQAGVTAASIEQARKSRKLPDSGELDAFAACMLKKFNIMKEDGSINQDVKSYQIFTDNVYIREISIGCKQRHGANVGETARKIMNCYLSANEIVLALEPKRI